MTVVLRTDLNLAQIGPTPDVSVGKNTVITDPEFNTRIVRATDRTVSAGLSLQTADSAQAGLWNLNDTLLLVRNTDAKSYLLQFNPASMQFTVLPLTFTGSLSFSKTAANVLFQLSGTQIVRIVLKQTAGVWELSSSSILADFATILPPGFKPMSTSAFVQSQDDSTFTVGFSAGSQDTGFYICCWQKGHGAKGFRMLNTQTGVISGKWGTTGQIQLTSQDTKVPFTFHEVYGCPNSSFAVISAVGSDTKLIWDIEDLTLDDNEMSGHQAYGFTSCFAGGPGGGQIAQATFLAPEFHKNVVLPQNLPSSVGQNYIGDRHFQFGKIVSTDNSIVWSSGSGVTPPTPFVSAWQDEVTGYDILARIVYRACHTYSSNTSPEFIVVNAIAVPSQTGKFVAFTSDWMKTLGNTPSGHPAGDVFVVEVE
jgi:hypothetical protein